LGTPEDPDFLSKNTGKGKYFPGGPTCNFKGKDVPCFVSFQESGGMTGELLKQVLMHMDDLKLFAEERAEGNQPFLLLDGHESRFSKV
jgi:hypothetical protein